MILPSVCHIISLILRIVLLILSRSAWMTSDDRQSQPLSWINIEGLRKQDILTGTRYSDMVPLMPPTCRSAVHQSPGRIRFLLPELLIYCSGWVCCPALFLCQTRVHVLCISAWKLVTPCFPQQQKKHPSLEKAWWLGADQNWQPMLPSGLFLVPS